MVEAQAQIVNEMKWGWVYMLILEGMWMSQGAVALVPPSGKHLSHDLNGTHMRHEFI